MSKYFSIFFLLFSISFSAIGQIKNDTRLQNVIYLDSKLEHGGNFNWVMKKANELNVADTAISNAGFPTQNWLPAVVPGTVLNSLVYNKLYPEPYFGINNKLTTGLIPDIAKVGRDFYTYWFRTSFVLPDSFRNKNSWLQIDGINYRAEIWLNGNMVGNVSGMFLQDVIDVSDFAIPGKENFLAVKVYPVDIPGTNKVKPWRARGENRNGGDGNIGLNTTMLMSVGWDFTFKDGIRDRNTGIWKSISMFSTNKLALRHPFVESKLDKPNFDKSNETVSVEVFNAAMKTVKCLVKGEIEGENIQFEKAITLLRGEDKTVVFKPEDFPQLKMQNPKLWWPVNKGKQNMYTVKLKVYADCILADSIKTKFAVRDIITDRNTPDSSKTFYVNGKKIFIRGSNWIPEAMLRNSDARMYAEMRYTQQSGINLLRIWGGGIAESDYFYQLCDEMGILVWQEFWLTGDTKHPQDKNLYFNNITSTVKRIRNHPSVAFYVCSNESTEVSGIKELLHQLDPLKPYQMQSETDGVHDGSPYQQMNPMQHYENTASDRGSRIDGFNPEYGAPALSTVEVLREMMPEKDLWPINKEVWDYLDGGGFHGMTGRFTELVNNYGKSNSIDIFAQKAQVLSAMNYRSIWEVWNYNKFGFGDKYASGLLFWYHNSPTRQVCARMWDWSLEPTSALYYSQNALEPLHAQFHYLKNTVSIYNDYLKSFNNCTLTADVYSLESKLLASYKKSIKLIPEDAVLNNLITIDFSSVASPVHFIKLRLLNESGNEVSSSFYWRSTDKYTGKTSNSGPAAGGFEPLSTMKKVSLSTKYSVEQTDNKTVVTVNLKNTSKSIAFFTQLQFLDELNIPVRPSFYTDNFFSLLPGEKKQVTIETFGLPKLLTQYHLVVKGYNVTAENFQLVKSTQK